MCLSRLLVEAKAMMTKAEKLDARHFMLQYITHYNLRYDYYSGAVEAIRGGCMWVQLRTKGATDDEVERTALRLMKLCREKDVVFILDDRVELCKKLGADGVHLGKTDMPINKARMILGNNFIIGATCNTFDDIISAVAHGADYAGVGPFRFTQTKKNLSPVLGLDGYAQIVELSKTHKYHFPKVAIGGIKMNDAKTIMDMGMDGLAVSGCILNAESPSEQTSRLISEINKSK